MNKKLFLTIAASSLLFGVVACGNQTPSTPVSEAPSETPSEVVQPSEAPASEAPSVTPESSAPVAEVSSESSNPWGGGGWGSFNWGDWSGWGQQSSNTPVSSVSSEAGPVINPSETTQGEFTITTDLSVAMDIHTAQQKAYLSYSGNYESIPTSQYPDGLKHLSDPEPVKLAWNHSAKDGKTLSRYSVIFGQKADLSDGYEVKGSSEKAAEIYNVFLGTNYFKVVAVYSDGSSEESPIKSFNVDATYPRNLKIDGMTNCRDLGGRLVSTGAKIKQGMIYRTSATSGWGNGRAVIPDTITSAGKEEMLNHLKVKTEINVNSSGSQMSGIKNYVAANMDYSGARHHFSRNCESVKKYFATLANPDNYPIFFHCRIGTDRTGLCAILTNAILGVSKNDIFQDYLFSNFGNIQEKRYLGEQAGEDNILNYIADIDAMPGDTFQQKTYNMLLSIGVPATQLDTIIGLLTEGQKVTGNDNGQKIGVGDELTPSGVSKTTSSDGKNPSVYYQINSGKSVSYKFTADEAYSAKLVSYMGNTDSSTSKYVDSGLKVEVDGKEVTVPHTSHSAAGFGRVNNSRTAYYPVHMGEVDLTAGEHTVTITGKSSDTYNVGTIAVFNKVTKSTGGTTDPVTPVDPVDPEPEVPATHEHAYVDAKTTEDFGVKTCSCGKAILSRPNLQTGKWDNSKENVWEYKFTVGKATAGVVQMAGKVTSNGGTKLFCNGTDTYDTAHAGEQRIFVSINGVDVPLTNEQTYSEMGILNAVNYFDLTTVNLVEGENTIAIKVPQGVGYRIALEGEVRVLVDEYVKA